MTWQMLILGIKLKGDGMKVTITKDVPDGKYCAIVDFTAGSFLCPYCVGDIESFCIAIDEPNWLVSDEDGNVTKHDKCPNKEKV
jgi:hypothetical protein